MCKGKRVFRTRVHGTFPALQPIDYYYYIYILFENLENSNDKKEKWLQNLKIQLSRNHILLTQPKLSDFQKHLPVLVFDDLKMVIGGYPLYVRVQKKKEKKEKSIYI